MDPSYNNSFGSFNSAGGQDIDYGAVVLSSSPSTKKKKVSIIVSAVLACVIVGVAIVTSIIMNSNTIATDFKQIVSFIEDVPEDFEWPEEDEDYSEEKGWVYAILVSNYNTKDISSYYDDLYKKYDSFFEKHGSRVSKDLMEEYSNMLKVLKNLVDYRRTENDLARAFESGGVEGANEFLERNVNCGPKDDYLKMVCDAEMEYYGIILLLYTGTDDDPNINSELTSIRYRIQSGFVLNNISRTIRKINEEVLGGLDE